MTKTILSTERMCPTCRIPLVRIPEPLAHDLAICPDCARGGDFDFVITNLGALAENRIALADLDDMLLQGGYFDA